MTLVVFLYSFGLYYKYITKMAVKFGRPKGLGWDNSLYRKLIDYIVENSVNIDAEQIQSLSSNNTRKLSKHVFEKHGHRTFYQNTVQFFLENFSETIIKDSQGRKNGSEDVIAPKLKLWLEYKNDVILAMMDIKIRSKVINFIADTEFVLQDKEKKIILKNIYGIKDEKYDALIIKKLNNALQWNRTEICIGIQRLIDDNNRENNTSVVNCTVLKEKTNLQVSINKNDFVETYDDNSSENRLQRRSKRKSRSLLLKEKEEEINNKISSGCQIGLKMEYLEGKERGVIATRNFTKNEFVVEYIGELIDANIAQLREIEYAKNKDIGCYMYYFRYKNKNYCIDATPETENLGRLINHSLRGNTTPKVVEVESVPHLVLFAKADILPGTEIIYNYGDKNQDAIRCHPWLAQ